MVKFLFFYGLPGSLIVCCHFGSGFDPWTFCRDGPKQCPELSDVCFLQFPPKILQACVSPRINKRNWRMTDWLIPVTFATGGDTQTEMRRCAEPQIQQATARVHLCFKLWHRRCNSGIKSYSPAVLFPFTYCLDHLHGSNWTASAFCGE